MGDRDSTAKEIRRSLVQIEPEFDDDFHSLQLGFVEGAELADEFDVRDGGDALGVEGSGFEEWGLNFDFKARVAGLGGVGNDGG